MFDHPLGSGRLRLRAPVRSDRDERLVLGHVPEVARGFGVELSAATEMAAPEADRWIAELLAAEHSWVIDLDGRFIGTIRLHSVVPGDARASLAVAIFDADKLGNGYGSQAISLVTGYAFRELGLHRLAIRVLASNVRAIRCYKRCGFRIEGRERESARVGGHWEDDLTMGMLEPESSPASGTG